MRTALFFCKLPNLFLTVKIRLGHKFSQFLQRSGIGIFCVLVLGGTCKFFPISKDILVLLNVSLAGVLNFSQFLKKMKNWVF